MSLPFPINKWLNPELILFLKQESQDPSSLMPQHTQDKLDFAPSHNPAGSLNRCAMLTSQDHCPGFEGCKHLISIATEHLLPALTTIQLLSLHAVAVTSGHSSKLLCF